jgi:hypothetical protein
MMKMHSLMSSASRVAQGITEGKMISQATINKLREMHMSHVAEVFRQQSQGLSMNGVSFDDRFGIIVDIEYSARKDNRLKRLVRKARFDPAIARASDSFTKTIAAYAKVRLLILDKWLLIKITGNEVWNLLETIHKRHQKSSTIFCFQFAPTGWSGQISESTLADAILYRIAHSSYTLELKFSKKKKINP